MFLRCCQHSCYKKLWQYRPRFRKKTLAKTPEAAVPNKGYPTTILMGGWLLGIPSTSENKDLAWEMISLMLDPKIITPLYETTGYCQHRFR